MNIEIQSPIPKPVQIKVNAPFRSSDPFMEPFEKGIMIDDNFTKTHRLMFSKFPQRPYHCLVATKEREPQTTPLSIEDFEATLKTMKALDGFAYFNCGTIAGSSVPHKHCQIIPLKSLSQGRLLIDDQVKSVFD